MKNFSTLLLVACVSLASCAPQPKTTTTDPLESAVTVNSIAPDRGLADPHAMIVNDTIYVMCGHDKTWNTRDFCQMDRWELWQSTNMEDWNYVLSIRNVDTYMGKQDNCWAGDLAQKDGKFYWYFSNRNFDTGVMVAPSMHGPWEDALGKPLLPSEIVPNKKPYDPEIYEEDGVYSIIFGVSQYHIATLGDDMISLKDKPEKILIFDAEGKKKLGADKPSMFKRGDFYYLWWGNKYAMSKNLRGPYEFKGDFIGGQHGSVIEWKGVWYAIQEQHEGNAFYRGVQIVPFDFNEDGTVKLPEFNEEYPLPGRTYDFRYTTQGWHNEGGGTEVLRQEDGTTYIYGMATKKGAIVCSIPFLHHPAKMCSSVKVKIHNESGAKLMRVALCSYEEELRPYTRKAPQQVNWAEEEWVDIALSGRWEEEITIPFSAFKSLKDRIHQIALQPIADKSSGKWVVVSVELK